VVDLTASNNERWSPYILIISGPAGSGKSSVSVALWKSLPDHPAYIDIDSLKNLIWDVTSSNDNLDLASRNALSITQNFLDSRKSVILDKAFCKYFFVQPFIEEGKRRGLPVHYFKLIAPLPVLIARNRRRWQYTAEQLQEQVQNSLLKRNISDTFFLVYPFSTPSS
jgi:predicted ABC-type ATPase